LLKESARRQKSYRAHSAGSSSGNPRRIQRQAFGDGLKGAEQTAPLVVVDPELLTLDDARIGAGVDERPTIGGRLKQTNIGGFSDSTIAARRWCAHFQCGPSPEFARPAGTWAAPTEELRARFFFSSIQLPQLLLHGSASFLKTKERAEQAGRGFRQKGNCRKRLAASCSMQGLAAKFRRTVTQLLQPNRIAGTTVPAAAKNYVSFRAAAQVRSIGKCASNF